MIKVLINGQGFEYDIHSLVKAFYPGEDVIVSEDIKDPKFTVFFSGNQFAFTSADGGIFKSADVTNDTARPEVKNILKRLLYNGLSEYTGKTLKWGDLTGIRPTKIPMKLLNEGKNDNEILSYMKDTYLVSDEKAELSLDIAKREKRILDPIDTQKGYSIYIGIPFCPSTCLYCSFTSNPISKYKDRIDEYIACIEKELAFVTSARKDKKIDTVYIGGGTPTSLSADKLESLLAAVDRYIDVNALLEYTVEAGRPDSIDEDKLNVMKAHKVTRISVNPQTMNDKTLKLIGRAHTSDDVIRAFGLARKAGFDNINTDIILGLPGEGEAEVRHTIDEIVKLSPDSLTVHSLAVKRGSRLHEALDEKLFNMLNNSADIMDIAASGAELLGLRPYYLYRQKNMVGNFENTGYAREGKYGIYNILIMEEIEPIIALGAGSVSKVLKKDAKPERCDNVKDVGLYMADIDAMIERKRVLFEHEND